MQTWAYIYILYQYLENDVDGKVDNPKFLKALVKRNGGMIINNAPQAMK